MIRKIAIVGGGASGFFAAITAAEEAKLQNSNVEIHIFESALHYLQKVKISGGGRCNVTHHQFDIKEFISHYPRGFRELRSAFYQFQAKDTVEWFKQKGVKLVAEADGRMFPITNKSDTIINCFMKQAQKHNILIHTKSSIQSISKEEDRFKLKIKDGHDAYFDKVLMATGSSKKGYEIVKNLGHKITDLAPSLFSFKINASLLKNLAGTSFSNVSIKTKVNNKKFNQSGALIITHWGLSGPAILKLSSWAARKFKHANYKSTLQVNWLNKDSIEQTIRDMESLKRNHPKTLIKNCAPEGLTKNFWSNFLDYLNISKEKVWSEISKKDFNKITTNLFDMPLETSGQNRFKDEFVECGGIELKEVNFKTMESKILKGLYFSGELLDIDGVTGGFNFQNAWTTGYIAGKNMVK